MVLIGQPNVQPMEVWEPDTYPAEILSVELTESTWPGKEGTPRLKWVIRVKHPESGESNDIWYWTNATLTDHPAATFRPLVKAVLPDLVIPDFKADPDFTVDTDQVVGKRCRVVLGIDEKRNRNRVDSVLAARATPATSPRRAAAAAPAEEDTSPGF